MHMPDILVSEFDFVRLKRLLDYEFNEELESELMRADIHKCILVPPSLVTMESKVLYIDHTEKEEKESLLVFSRCPEGQDQVISILSSIGTALLGLEVGEKIDWLIDGRKKVLEVIGVNNQPEASGYLHPLSFNNEFQQVNHLM